MVTDQTRKTVWQSMLDAERLVRYYEALSDRYRRNHAITRITMLVGATGAIAPLLQGLVPESYQNPVHAVSSAIIALAVAWDFFFGFAEKAAILQGIRVDCSALETEWQDLWNSIESFKIQDEEAQKKNTQLNRRITEVTRRTGDVGIRENRRINEKCTEDAYKVAAERYAA